MEFGAHEAPLNNTFQKERRELASKGSLGRRRRPSRATLKCCIASFADSIDFTCNIQTSAAISTSDSPKIQVPDIVLVHQPKRQGKRRSSFGRDSVQIQTWERRRTNVKDPTEEACNDTIRHELCFERVPTKRESSAEGKDSNATLAAPSGECRRANGCSEGEGALSTAGRRDFNGKVCQNSGHASRYFAENSRFESGIKARRSGGQAIKSSTNPTQAIKSSTNPPQAIKSSTNPPQVSNDEPEWISLSRKLCAKFIEEHLECSNSELDSRNSLKSSSCEIDGAHAVVNNPARSRHKPLTSPVMKEPKSTTNEPDWISLSRKLCTKFVEQNFESSKSELPFPHSDQNLRPEVDSKKVSRKATKSKRLVKEIPKQTSDEPEWVSLSRKLRAKFIEGHLDDPNEVAHDNGECRNIDSTTDILPPQQAPSQGLFSKVLSNIPSPEQSSFPKDDKTIEREESEKTTVIEERISTTVIEERISTTLEGKSTHSELPEEVAIRKNDHSLSSQNPCSIEDRRIFSESKSRSSDDDLQQNNFKPVCESEESEKFEFPSDSSSHCTVRDSKLKEPPDWNKNIQLDKNLSSSVEEPPTSKSRTDECSSRSDEDERCVGLSSAALNFEALNQFETLLCTSKLLNIEGKKSNNLSVPLSSDVTKKNAESYPQSKASEDASAHETMSSSAGFSDSESCMSSSTRNNSYTINGSSSVNETDFSDCSLSVKCDESSNESNQSTVKGSHSGSESPYYYHLHGSESNLQEVELREMKKCGRRKTEDGGEQERKCSSPPTPKSLRHIFSFPLNSVPQPRLLHSSPKSFHAGFSPSVSSSISHSSNSSLNRPKTVKSKKTERSSSIKIKDIAYGIILTFRRFQNSTPKPSYVLSNHYVDVSHLATSSAHKVPNDRSEERLKASTESVRDPKKQNDPGRKGHHRFQLNECRRDESCASGLSNSDRMLSHRGGGGMPEMICPIFTKFPALSDVNGHSHMAATKRMPEKRWTKKVAKNAKKSPLTKEKIRDEIEQTYGNIRRAKTESRIPNISRKVQQTADGTLYLVTTVSGDNTVPGLYPEPNEDIVEPDVPKVPTKTIGESNC